MGETLLSLLTVRNVLESDAADAGTACALSDCMDSWQDVTQHVRSAYRLTADEPDHLNMTWQFQGTCGVVQQRQYIGRTQALGHDAAMLVADVVPADRVAPLDALVHNAVLAVGSLAVINETLVLRSVVEIRDLSRERLDAHLEALAHEAARLREVVLGRASDDDVAGAFVHWCEGD